VPYDPTFRSHLFEKPALKSALPKWRQPAEPAVALSKVLVHRSTLGFLALS
jgi:hypothetical protein